MKKCFVVLMTTVLLFSFAVPVYAADAVVESAPVVDPVYEFFPLLFSGINLLFESPPIMYLLGIFVLAFIILIFKMIFHP